MAELELSIDIRKMLQQMKRLEDAFRKQFPGALDAAEDALDDFEDAAQKSMKGASDSTKQLNKSLKNVDKQIGELKSSMAGLSASMKGIGRGFSSLTTAALGLGAAYGIKEFVMFGATYERTINKLKAVTRSYGEQGAKDMLLLRKAIRETGASTEFTATQAAEAAANLAAMGMPAKEVAGSLQLMVASAQALQSPIEEVSRIIKAQQNIFQISTKEIADTLTGAYTTSAANLQKLDVSLRILGGSAKQAGLSFQETIGALAFMIDRGQSAERAGTALRSVMAQLSKPTKEARMQMEKLGLSFDDIKDSGFERKLKEVARAIQQVESATERERIVMNLFNLETAGAAATLIEGFMEGKDVISQMADQVGKTTTAMKVADEMTNDVLASVRNLGSALQDRVLEVWQTMEPVIKRILDDVTTMVRSLTDEDIYSAMESIGVGLIGAAEGFYNLIKGAVDGIAALINSPQVASLMQTAKTLITVVAGPDLSTQLAEAEGRVNELYARIRIAEEQQKATQEAAKDGNFLQKGLAGLNNVFNSGDIEEWRAELAQAEKDLARLQKMQSKSEILPSIEGMGINTKSLAQTLKDNIALMRKNRAEQAGMKIQDASTLTPGKANIQYGNKTGLELTPEDRKSGGKSGGGSTSTVDALEIPERIKAMLPSMEAFNGLTKENQKLVMDAMAETLKLTEAEGFLASQQADAQALIAKSLGIQAEQLAKPALMQAQLVENVERLNQIYEKSTDNLEIFNALQGERVRLESQFSAAVSQGSGEQAKNLDAQLKAIEALLSGTQAVMVSEAKAAIEQEKRLNFSESLVGFAERANEIGQSNQHYEKGYADLKQLSGDLAAFQASQEAEMTAEKRAQVNSMWEYIRLEEEALRLKEEQAKIPVGQQAAQALGGSFGIFNDVATNTQGFKDLATGVADQGMDFSFDPKSAAGGPMGMALDAILKVVTKLEVFQAAIDATVGTLMRVLDAVFSPITNAIKELTKSFQPVIDVLAELSQVIFDAFTPLKPFVALAKGVFKVIAQALKSLVVALKPLTHAMQQVTNIITSIFGGGGSGSFGSKIEDLEGALQTVRDAMQDLKFSDMNPADSITQLKDATEEYDKLRQAAFGDNATQEDIQKFTDFAKTYLGLSKEVNKSSSAYTEDFERVAGDLEGLETKLGDSLAGIDEDPMGFGGFIEMLWEWLEGLLEKIVQAVVEAFQKLLNGAMSIVKWLYDKVVEILTKGFEGAFNLIGQLVSIVTAALQRGFEGQVNFFSYLVTVVRDVLQRGFSGAINFLGELYNIVVAKIEEGLEGYWNFLKDFYQAIWDKFKEGLEGYWNFLKDVYTIVWNKIVEGFNGTITFLSDLYYLVLNKIIKGFNGAVNWISNLITIVANKLVEGFTGYVSWLSDTYKLVLGIIQQGFSGTVNFLTKIATEIGNVIERGLTGTVSFFSTVVEKVSAFLERGFTGTFDFVATVRDKIIGLLTGSTSILQTIIDKILSALGLKGFSKTIPILPNPFKSFLGGPTNFLELDFSFAKGGQVPSYAAGGMAVGPSHQSGMLGMTKKGTPFLFEGDEFILNKKSSKVLGPQLLNALNQVGTSREAMGAMSGILNAYQLTTMASGGNVGSNFNVALRSNGLGDMNLLYLNNPLRDYAGPNHWYVKASPDLKKGSLGLTRNIFASGGSLLELQKQTMNPLAPFGSNARFNVSGNLSGNSWSKNLINISNPLTYVAREIDKFVKKWLSLLSWVWEPVYKNVTKVLGPDRLKLGINGKMLDFWNSRLNANFGGDVLNKLGFGSLPTPSTPSVSFSNGGMVTGPSHAMGGRMAELEGGEFVINRRAAQAYGYANLASINNGGSDAILQKITQALSDLSKPQIEVHVYTDMRGEARAEISKFRYEVRQKAERSRINPTEKLVPLSAI